MPSDVAIVVPKLDELETILWAFGLDLEPSGRLSAGGYTYHCEIGELRVCFAFMDGQDTLRAGLATFEILRNEGARYAFLVGTALGSEESTPIGSVVVSGEVDYLVELRYDTKRDTLDFRNPDRIKSKGNLSPRARTQATRVFTQRLLETAIRDAGEYLRRPDLAEELIATYRPKVLVEAIGSSNIYYKSPKGRADLVKKALFDRGKGFRLYDMESAGFARAADACGVEWVVIRGISDYGNKLGEDVRRIATAAAGRCLHSIIEAVCDPAESVRSLYEYRLDGTWRGLFAYIDADGELTALADTAHIEQVDASTARAAVTSTLECGSFAPATISYRVSLDLLKQGYVAGTWTDGRQVEKFFGVMLAELSDDSAVLNGSWLGRSQAASTRGGRFAWYLESRNGRPAGVTVPSVATLIPQIEAELRSA